MATYDENANFLEHLGEYEHAKEIRRLNPLPIWATPPWPEWSDSAIDAEVWEYNVCLYYIYFLF